MTRLTNKPSLGFWIIGTLTLIWNLLGVHGYIQQAYNTDAFRAQYSSEQLEIIDHLPIWVTAAFAIAVFSSALGCLLMLAKNKMSNLLFKIGLLAVVVQTIFNLFINEGKQYYGSMEYSMLIMIPLISVFLVWYSDRSIKNGWLS